MKAAVFHGPQRGLQVEEVPAPVAGPGEALVRVAACGVCHTDLHYLDHGVPTFQKPPIILGHEASGVVVECGQGTDAALRGTSVLIPPVFPCGSCPRCREGRENICLRMEMLGNHRDGAFAEFVRAPARHLIPLPAELPLEESCVIADAVATPYHAVVRRGNVRPGDRVAVVGAGGVGVNVVQIAAAVGARVAALDLSESRLETASSLGAEAAIPARDGKAAVREVRRWSGGGVDVAFECVGSPQTIATSQACLRPGGRLVIVGYSEKPAEIEVAKVMFFEQDIVGSLGCRVGDLPAAIDLVRAGRVKLDPIVTGRYPLTRIHEALDALRHGIGLRGLVLPHAP